ncbi:MAG: DUF3992 domain-containing protein [Paenibacillaceae bacterium]|nr:DUF3992 domain-containing protein [Paenibacillaceae bacterium]
MGCFADIQSPRVAYSHLTCCAQSTYVQDQLCTQINIAPEIAAFAQELYVVDINPAKLFVSGTLFISAAPAGRVLTVNFFLGGAGGTLVETDTVIPGTALAFTKTGFDTIQLAVTAGIGVTPNITGELCLTVRYPVA